MSLDRYKDLRVLLTGHTGFKGAWLTSWLVGLGAEVIGCSLTPPTTPNLFQLCALERYVQHHHMDIRDNKQLLNLVQEQSPDLIIHLAAQSLVLDSYENPRETFEVNTQGTVNVLNAAMHSSNTAAVLVITTDKVYENNEWPWGYRENDRLGGHDPYSASKAMAEIAAVSYRQSFGAASGMCIATARAGNVIGGGDFSDNRLLPDTMKALMANRPVQVRNPRSVRPWMHVLDPLYGYLWLGSQLLSEGDRFADAWNFAPKDAVGANCQQVVERAVDRWGGGDWVDTSSDERPKETSCLRLNGDKAAHKLEWTALYDWKQAVDMTVDWFKAFNEGADMYAYTLEQINAYMSKAEGQAYAEPRL